MQQKRRYIWLLLSKTVIWIIGFENSKLKCFRQFAVTRFRTLGTNSFYYMAVYKIYWNHLLLLLVCLWIFFFCFFFRLVRFGFGFDGRSKMKRSFLVLIACCAFIHIHTFKIVTKRKLTRIIHSPNAWLSTASLPSCKLWWHCGTEWLW